MIHHTALQAKTLNVRRSALEPMGVLARVSDIEDCARRGYFADPEYNRKQHGHVKTILSANMEVINITCDLIVHSRGRVIQNDNMIAIEMAKPNKTAADILADRSRLRALTKSSYDGVWSYGDGAHPEHVCGYVMGLFIMVDRINRVVQTELFRSGEKVSRFDDLPF
jgi:hypothetical protein